MTLKTIFSRGEPLHKYATKRFNGKLYKAASVEDKYNSEREALAWRKAGYKSRILRRRHHDIVYLRE